MAKRSGLVPNQIVNKNGVRTTVHKKPAQSANAHAVPAPSLPVINKPSASKQQKLWRVRIDRWGDCDQELRHICTKVFTKRQSYDCSEAEAYDVMSAVNPENTLPLLSIGVRSAADARTMLDEIGLGRLKADNALAEKAIERGIPALDFLVFSGEYHKHTKLDPFVDAAECASINVMKQATYTRTEVNGLKSIPKMILDGEVSWDDIKQIDMRKAAELLSGRGPLLDHLVQLKKGTSVFNSAFELADLIATSDHPNVTMNLAAVYGVENMKRIPANTRGEAYRIVDAMRGKKYSPEESFAVFEYTQRIGLYPKPEDIVELYEAGVTSEDARNGIINQLTATQIIAITTEGINPAVSSGYL